MKVSKHFRCVQEMQIQYNARHAVFRSCEGKFFFGAATGPSVRGTATMPYHFITGRIKFRLVKQLQRGHLHPNRV